MKKPGFYGIVVRSKRFSNDQTSILPHARNWKWYCEFGVSPGRT
jgi:hypothetical protein